MTDPAEARLLKATLAHALDYLAELETGRVAPELIGTPLIEQFRRPLPGKGMAAEEVIDRLVAEAGPGLMNSAGGRFFGWVIGGALPSSVAADWLTTVWDQNAGMHAVSPSAAAVEEVCGEWLKELLGLPATSSFALVTGCQMAHATCLAAARNAVLAAKHWNVETRGLAGSPRIRVLTSSERHGTIDRALRLIGIGTEAVQILPADVDGRLSPVVLKAALSEVGADEASIVVLQAGDLNIGAFDDFEALIPLAHEAGAWVHIDGAFGLWAKASPLRKHLLAGVDAADSWSTDGHKWLNVPYDCGYAFVADPVPHHKSMSYRATYLDHADGLRDQVDWNPEHSRRARGFSTYAAICELGREGIADLVERCCQFTTELAQRVGALDGARLLRQPILNQALVQFVHPDADADAKPQDEYNDRVIAGIVASGEAFFGGTTWRGSRCMRISVCNWRTSASDVDRTVDAIRSVLAAVQPD